MILRTRRWVFRWCVAVLFLGCVIGPVESQTPGAPARPAAAVRFPTEGEVVGNSVAIRSQSLKTGTRLAVAFKGDRLQVLGDTGNWYKVALPRDYSMWISKEFVAAGPNKIGVVTGDNVRVRAGAGLEYQTVGHLDRGRRVEIAAEKAGWLKFKFVAGDAGYIATQYLKLSGEESPRLPGPIDRQVKPVQPAQPVQPVVEPVADEKVMAMFNEAEGIYRKEVRKERIVDWDLEKARTLYISVLEKTRNINLIRKCRSRCAVIAYAKRYQEAARKHKDPRRRLADREREIDEEFARRQKALRDKISNMFPSCIAAGHVERLASRWLKPATHKLVSNDRITHILYSKSVDLKAHEGELVGIEGEPDRSVKWPIPALRVTHVVVSGKKDKPTEATEAGKTEKEPGAEEEAKEKETASEAE